MINIIFPIDPSTQFLSQIIDILIENGVACNVIEVLPNDQSYSESKEKIKELNNDWDLIFLGHGQPNQLYGG